MAENWIDENNTNFTTFVAQKFKEYKITDDIKKFDFDASSTVQLNSYQKLLSEFISDDTNYRGILVNHGLGSGKTLSSIAIAESMDRKVIVLLPATLKKNFIKDLISHINKYNLPSNYNVLSEDEQKIAYKELMKQINKKYSFVSSNAWNTYATLENVEGIEELDRLIANDILENGTFKKKNALDNKLLIIDEVHNILVNIINPGSKNGIRVYNQIMDAKNLKLVFLSGTPVIKDPFELAVLFNMLRGYLYIKGDRTKYTAFPVDYDEFNKYFIDRKDNMIKNKAIFQERINGLVSFYSGVLEDENRTVFPHKNKPKIEVVEMSDFQWKKYIYYRKDEIEKERIAKHKIKDFTKTALKKPTKDVSGSYRINSRQISNFTLPEHIKRPKWSKELKMDEIYKSLLLRLTKQDLVDNLNKYSAKMARIFENIKKSEGLILIYSDFKNLGGIGTFARVLEENNWTNFNKILGDPEEQVNKMIGGNNNKWKNLNMEKMVGGSKESHTFAIFSGDTNITLREKILGVFNSNENMYGEKIKILMITGAGAEGLDLKNIRQIHILEPYWNKTRTDQVIGRGVRINSHINLPIDKRVVDIFIYIAVPPGKNQKINEIIFGKEEKVTTDVYLLDIANRKQKLLDQFLNAMREIAIDCQINFNHNKQFVDTCRVCIPNNKLMFYPNIKTHMIPGNSNCADYKKQSKSDFQEIRIAGQTYMYNKNNKKVYRISNEGGVKQFIYDSLLTEIYQEKLKKQASS